MAFMLVIAPVEPQSHPERQNWASFHTMAGLTELAQAEGVYGINECSWIFDTKKALVSYAKLIHEAGQSKVRLHVFQLDAESVLAHGVSYPRSEKLEAFLSS